MRGVLKVPAKPPGEPVDKNNLQKQFKTIWRAKKRPLDTEPVLQASCIN